MKIALENVSLRFGAGDYLLQNVSLAFEPGQFAIVNGPSGSGKSSFLRLLNRLQDPTAGRLLFDDEPVEDAAVPHLRRRIGFVQQTPVMLEGNVRHNLLLPYTYRLAGAAAPPDDPFLRSQLERYLLDIDLEEDTQPLSVGQRQRLSLIRSQLVEPEVILCDEPTSALDPDSRRVVEERLSELCTAGGVTVVVVTHFDRAPKGIACRRLRLGDGKLVKAS